MTEEDKMVLPGASPEVREDAHAVTSEPSAAPGPQEYREAAACALEAACQPQRSKAAPDASQSPGRTK